MLLFFLLIIIIIEGWSRDGHQEVEQRAFNLKIIIIIIIQTTLIIIITSVIKESGLELGQAEPGATNASILLRFGHQPSHFWSAARTHGLEYKYKTKIRRNTITRKYICNTYQ